MDKNGFEWLLFLSLCLCLCLLSLPLLSLSPSSLFSLSLFVSSFLSLRLIDEVSTSARTLRIGLMEGVIYLGIVSGYLLGGELLSRYGFLAVFVGVVRKERRGGGGRDASLFAF